MPETLPRYNGWANKPTWQVHLWITNDEQCYYSALAIVNDKNTADKVTALREYVEHFMLDDLTSQASLASDMLSWALSYVNWEEIVQALEEE